MAPTTEASQYFSPDPLPPSDPTTVQLDLPDVSLTMTSDRGVFSREHVDVGTKLLLLTPSPVAQSEASEGDHIVDIGSGYGPIALTVARRNPRATVWAVDVNKRARDLCQLNAKAADTPKVNVVSPSEVPPDISFKQIWSNPPIRIGKKALHELLRLWLPRLTPEGAAHLVVQKHLGADSLQKWIGSEGFETSRYRSQKAFRLLLVTKKSTPLEEGSQ